MVCATNSPAWYAGMITEQSGEASAIGRMIRAVPFATPGRAPAGPPKLQRMFHVITVHWHDDKWIEPQLRYLDRFMPEHRVYAALNGIDTKWNDRFFYAEDM